MHFRENMYLMKQVTPVFVRGSSNIISKGSNYSLISQGSNGLSKVELGVGER
jgi:hypothetical protein